MVELAGRTALVTGATSDLGRALVLELASAGADVHALGRREEKLASLAASSSGGKPAVTGNLTALCAASDTVPQHSAKLDAQFGTVTPHSLDLRDEAAVARLLATVGPIDILVLNAAHPPEAAPFLLGGMDKLRPIMEVNFFSPAQFVLALLPGMLERQWGRVIAISSLAAAIGEAHGPSYCASKAAFEGLMRNLAIDYSPGGITFNVIEPGPVMTERLQVWGPAKARRFALASAVRRVAQPEDVAHAVLFLASPRAGHITGEELRVDGGLHLGNAFAAMYVRPGSPEQAGS